jgi:hypothetical protein
MCVGARLLWGRTEERLFLEIGCHELAPRLNAGQPTLFLCLLPGDYLGEAGL